MFAFESGYLNLCAHGGLRHRERNDAVQIVAFAHKERMLLYVQHHVEITGRAARGTNLATSGEADAGSIFHARGNLRINRTLPQNATFAFALETRIGDHAASSLTSGASARDAEKSLLIAHLAAARTRAARRGPFAWSRARTVALFTGFVPANHHTSLGTEGS